ncbi:hypothetical protein [Cerasicoccus maritimus]|uniref:hypothetical protein n=1 Tax=Cerasicoccus maritimus TaxID=490089 RepID=UPI002852CA02|nr:hypothetical protein [Cerasicoccus maritimus]
MFLRNARQLRLSAIVVLALVVNLAGVWPMLSQPAAQKVDLFQRYSEFMSLREALEHSIGEVEFCGQAPTPENLPANWEALPSHQEAKLILLGQATHLVPPPAAALPQPTEPRIPGLRRLTPEPPPPRA